MKDASRQRVRMLWWRIRGNGGEAQLTPAAVAAAATLQHLKSRQAGAK